MRNFDFYEFTGILVPGAISVFGFALISPEIDSFVKDRTLSVGDLGVFLILSYAVGHLIQSVGNILEKGWWGLCGGWPYDWARTGKRFLLSKKHNEMVNEAVIKKLNIKNFELTAETDKSYWYGITRQIYITVESAGKTGRIEIFNGNYGLSRGIATSLIVILILTIVQSGFAHLCAEAGLGAAIILATYRMHRFSCHYSKELFLQFIQLLDEKES